MQQLARLRNRIEPVERLTAQADELQEWVSLLESDPDLSRSEHAALREAVERFRHRFAIATVS